MNASDVIGCILEHEKLKAATFATSIGAKATQIYDLQSGKTKKISPLMAEKIINTYPSYSRIWLLTGEGEMLRIPSQNDGKTDMSTTFTGTFTKPIVADIKNVIGSGNIIGDSIPRKKTTNPRNHASSNMQKKAENPAEANAEVAQLYVEIERIKAENELLRNKLELKETIIEHKNLIIEEKDKMISFLKEKK